MNILFQNKSLIKSSTLFVLFLLLITLAEAQDIHFSQFTAVPMNLNPSLAGQFNGDYRFVANERTQWRSITKPFTYRTFGGSVDARNLLQLNNIGVGLSIYNDKAGDSNFGTLQLNLAASYTKPINEDASQLLTFGIQSGFTQKKISTEKLSFDNQYDGLRYDPSRTSNETLENTGRMYPNLNIGMVWQYLPFFQKKVKKGLVGISLHNINQPKQSFFKDDAIVLDRRLNIHLSGHIEMIKDIDLLPALLWMGQGKYREFNIGTSVKYMLDERPFHYRAIYLGGWYRNKDASFVSAGMDYNKIHVGVSYDINLSPLRAASNSKGGFEFSVVYIIERIVPIRQNYKSCPDFI